ncbi:MAG: hypothetical protein RL254_1616 [Planctomycetota bacterium]
MPSPNNRARVTALPSAVATHEAAFGWSPAGRRASVAVARPPRIVLQIMRCDERVLVTEFRGCLRRTHEPTTSAKTHDRHRCHHARERGSATIGIDVTGDRRLVPH